MSRYIKADSFDERVRKSVGLVEEELTDDFKDGVRCTLELLKTEPTADVVEVVRCCDADKGDCMFNHWHETPNGDKYHICNLNQLSFSEHEDFYCAYGERREDDKGRSD